MAKVNTKVTYEEAGKMKQRGMRQLSETTRAIEAAVRDKLEAREFGKTKGFLLELEPEEQLKSVRPKVGGVAKKLEVTLGTETREDDQALWIWVQAEGRVPRQPRQTEESPAAPPRSRRRG
jgi:hypothetical protein